MNELYREIEEDIRRERLDRWWKNFGKLMVAASVAVVLTTIIAVVVKDRSRTKAMEYTSQLLKASQRSDAGDYAAAHAGFDALIKADVAPYNELALLRKAQTQKAQRDIPGATQTYQQLAARGSEFGQLAATLASKEGELSEPSRESPFYFTQNEMKAWQQWGQGKKEEATERFLAMYRDKNAPQTLTQRLQEVLQHIAPEKLKAEE